MKRLLAQLLHLSSFPLACVLMPVLVAPAAWAQTYDPGSLRESRACAFLGDRLGARRDVDAFTFEAAPNEQVEVRVEERDDPRNRGAILRLRLRGGGASRAVGALPLHLEWSVRRAGTHTIRLRQPRRVGRRFARLGQELYEGEYCVTLRSSGSAADTLLPTSQVEVQWVAIEEGVAARPPFERKMVGAASGLIQPEFPLRGGAVYGLILTRGARGLDGSPVEPSDDFRAETGSTQPAAGGPVALYSSDPEAVGNPFPEARLVSEGGGIVLPARVVLRGLDPTDPDLAAARDSLLETAEILAGLTGFGTTTPVRLDLSAPLDLASVTPENLLFFERTDGRLDLASLLREARRHRVRPSEVALAISFPTQRIEHDMREARERLEELADQQHFGVTTEDPDPDDDLPLGVFEQGGQPDAPFADFLGLNPQVAAVVAGLLPAPDFRAADGAFDPARLSGDTPPEDVQLDFLLTLPAGAVPPYPAVIVQHGFGGDNSLVLEVGALLAEHGMAAIGISALVHGRRGIPTDLLFSMPPEAREIFRQTVVDQMSLLRAIEQGVDVDGDGQEELSRQGVGYIGISLGGLLGGIFAGIEDRLGPAVLNVMGGRGALLSESPLLRPLVAGARAALVGLPVDSPEFDVYFARFLELASLGQDPADTLNWARRYRDLPFPGAAPRRILIQQGEGDLFIPNAFTEELVHVAGLLTNTPQSDSHGVSGHWAFGLPGGHGIFSRDDVRGQAIEYLLSEGTEIREPVE